VDLGLRVLPGDGLGRAALTPLEGDLRALTVVEAEDRALGPDVGRPLRGDVLRVALDLDRPAVLRLGEDAVDGAALLEGGRVPDRLARDQVLRALGEGEDVL